MEKLFKSDFFNELSDKIKGNTTPDTSDFNIFKVLGIESKEVLMCRFLGELLDPNGKHGCGDLFLKNFIENVLGDTIKCDINKAQVVLEEGIDDKRRVDIVIYANKTIYPIEVKIWARDQNNQIYDYYNFYFKGNENGKIYYLTPTKSVPSAKSVNTLTENQYKCISFKNEIRGWLKSSIKELNDGIIKSICNQMIYVIDKMVEENVMSQLICDEINDYDKAHAIKKILDSKENIENYFKNKFLDTYINDIEDKKAYTFRLVNDNSEEKKADRFREGMVLKNKKTIAYLCVDTNLYLTIADGFKHKDTTDNGWKDNWIYINWRKSQKGNDHIDLRHPGDDVFKYIFNEENRKSSVENIIDFLDDIIEADKEDAE